MKLSKVLIAALLCVGLSSAADARHKPHNNKNKRHRPVHVTVSTPAPTPAPPPPPGQNHTSPPAPKPAPPPQHHTITPSVFSINSPGVWTYDATLTSGQVRNGDGFTIFDFGGYVKNSIFAPAGWSATAVLTGSVLNVAPPVGYVDDPTLYNLEFVRTGGTVGPTNGILDLGHFGASTIALDQYLRAWTSRDHAPDGSVGADHADRILAPGGSVPDGGTTVALLGTALAILGGMRRMIRPRKA
jgi:VPDSG-CTERM motif